MCPPEQRSYQIHSRSGSYLIAPLRSEEHTSELQSRFDLVCRLLLEKKKIKNIKNPTLDQTSYMQSPELFHFIIYHTITYTTRLYNTIDLLNTDRILHYSY